MNHIKKITPALSEIKTGTPGFKIGSHFFVGGIGGNFIPGTSGGATNFYKCASVGSGTWTGYKAVWNSTAGKYEFESSLTSDALTFTLVTPQVNKIYSADALINATLWLGIPTAGLVFHASLNNGAIETGNTLTTQSGSISYTTVDGIPCGSCSGFSAQISGKDTIPYGTSPRTFSMWYRTNNSNVQIIINAGQRDNGAFYCATRDSKFSWAPWDESRYPADYMESISTATDNRWHHLCVVFSGTEVIMYVDGTQEKSIVYTCHTNQSDFSFGSYDFVLYGCLAGVRIYNRALSASEVASLACEFTPTA